MAHRSSSYSSFGGFQLTLWVKRLIIVNTLVFLAVTLLPSLEPGLAFYPQQVLYKPWGIFTYMFVHHGFMHLFFNMLGLFFFGSPLEAAWGPREFIKFYIICGLGGALLSLVFGFVVPNPIVGASAALFGVMLAFAMNWPDAPIYVFGIFPVKAKWLVAIFVAFTLLSALTSPRDGVAHLAHLGGFAAAWLYLKLDFRSSLALSRVKRFVTRPRLTVVSGNAVQQEQQKPEPRRRVDERVYDDVDKVLDKISTQGMASLTAEEKKLLDEVSRRYRQN